MREWALSNWEERTQVSLAEELPYLKALILEAQEREARLMMEEMSRRAQEEAALAAAGFEHHRPTGGGGGRRRA